MPEGGMAESPAGRVPIQRRGHARFQVYSNPRSGRSYPQRMGIHFLELPPELGKGIAAFVADMRRDLGLEPLSDLFGRPLGEADRQGEPSVAPPVRCGTSRRSAGASPEPGLTRPVPPKIEYAPHLRILPPGPAPQLSSEH